MARKSKKFMRHCFYVECNVYTKMLNLCKFGGIIYKLNLQLTSQSGGITMAEKDFVIENGVLKSYKGRDGDVEIPSHVKTIGSTPLRIADH